MSDMPGMNMENSKTSSRSEAPQSRNATQEKNDMQDMPGMSMPAPQKKTAGGMNDMPGMNLSHDTTTHASSTGQEH